MEVLIGLILTMLAGLGTGTVAWPMKKIRDVRFEQYLFVFMFTAIIVYPWLVVLIFVPEPLAILQQVGVKPLLISNLLSVCWGIANVLYLIGVVRIGAALTGAILSAAGLCIGVTIPMIFKGSGLFNSAPDIFSMAGMMIITALVIVIAGIGLVSKAGFGREKILQQNAGTNEKTPAAGNFLKGLLLVVLAGFLSSGLSLGFVYGQAPVIAAAKSQGVSDIAANATVWAFCTLGGGLVNVGYAIYLMAKNRSWKKLFERKEELLYGSLIGLQFIGAIILLGRGMLLLGALGASVGFAIQQSLQVIGNQLVGFAGGEWKGIYGTPRRQMYMAIAFILVAVAVLAYSNTL